jgi:hypothetical protein
MYTQYNKKYDGSPFGNPKDCAEEAIEPTEVNGFEKT